MSAREKCTVAGFHSAFKDLYVKPEPKRKQQSERMQIDTMERTVQASGRAESLSILSECLK